MSTTHEMTAEAPQSPTRSSSIGSLEGDYQHVAKALLYLKANGTEQPGLSEVADHVGLSAYHFCRLLKRWAGVSPRRFLQFLTVEYARSCLAESHNALHTAYDAEVSRPSRAHDSFVVCEAVTPGEYKHRGAGLEVSYGFYDTPFGDCLLMMTTRGLCGLAFADPGGRELTLVDMQRRWPSAAYLADGGATESVMETIAYHLGWLRAAGPLESIDLFFMGTNFQVKVWEGLLRIPPGEMASYDAVGEMIGRSCSARAVAGAVAANPIALLVPCHRVIRNSGMIGGYYWGVSRKRAILGWEASRVSAASIRSFSTVTSTG
tara:strand:- start:2070 stop:3026 length:957 start_codon:yes stop_codon:yes gene_type:complete